MSFLDRYKHYDPAEGKGSPEEWAALADAMAEKIMGDWEEPEPKQAKGSKRLPKKPDPDLNYLFLDTMPNSVDRLKTAFRNSLHIYHPDKGGSNQATIKAIETYERLLKKLARRSKRNAGRS